MVYVAAHSSFPYTKWKSQWREEVNVMYVWTIKNFKDVFDNELNSPNFSAHGYEDTSWKLCVYAEGNWFGIKLILCSSTVKGFDVTYRFSLINSKGEEVNVMKESLPKHNAVPHDNCIGEFIKIKKLNGQAKDLLPDKHLTICCRLTFVVCEKHKNDDFLEMPKDELSNAFKSIFLSDKHSDVKFIVRGKQFPAHKIILLSRSKVFAEMFQNEENKKQSVTVTDISPPVFKEMLYFIYTGKIPKLGDMAEDLLHAANKYDLEELKFICRKIPCDIELSAQQAADLLFISDDYDAASLKAKLFMKIKSGTSYAILTRDGSNFLSHI